jgi:hypothetical protein
MEEVNAYFPMAVDVTDSRLRLRSLNVSNSFLSTLRSLFFDDNGSLLDSIMDDIDMSSKHAYIQLGDPSVSDYGIAT